MTLADGVKGAKDTFDAVVIQIRCSHESNDDEDDKVREIKNGEEDEENAIVVQAFAVRGGNMEKKITINCKSDPESMCIEISKDKKKQYLEIVDFDEHFNDVALDWTNPDFDQ